MGNPTGCPAGFSGNSTPGCEDAIAGLCRKAIMNPGARRVCTLAYQACKLSPLLRTRGKRHSLRRTALRYFTPTRALVARDDGPSTRLPSLQWRAIQ